MRPSENARPAVNPRRGRRGCGGPLPALCGVRAPVSHLKMVPGYRRAARMTPRTSCSVLHRSRSTAPGLADGINAMRTILPLCDFDAGPTAEGLKALKNYRKEWDEERSVWREHPRHDWASHGADGFRTMACRYREALPPPKKEKPPPLTLGLKMNMRQ